MPAIVNHVFIAHAAPRRACRWTVIPSSCTPQWRTLSVYVPKRDGRPRVEKVIQILLDPRPSSVPCDATDRRHPHESRDLCPGLDQRQGRDQTIDSQLEALLAWAAATPMNSKTSTSTSTRATPARGSTAPASTASATPPAGEFDVLGVYSPDRLARRYAYQVLLLEELRKAACDVEFIERPISDDPHDQLLLQIQGAIAEYERAVLAERFRRGKLQKARAGHWVGGQGPYGYRYVPKRDGVPGHLEIDEAEAAVVRMLYRWLIDERMTVRQILKRLAAGPWRPRNGKRLWSNTVVHRILSDPLYAGTAYANRSRARRRRRKPRTAGPRRACRPAASGGRARSGSRSRCRPSSTTMTYQACERTTRPQLGPLLPQQHPQRLPAPLPAHLPDVRPGHVSASPAAGPAGGVSIATTCATARTPLARDRAVPAARSPGPGSRSSTRPSGTMSSGCSTTRPRWPRSSRSGPGRPTRSTPAPTRRARSGRPSCAGSTARSSGCSTPIRPRRSTSTNSRSAASRSRRRRMLIAHGQRDQEQRLRCERQTAKEVWADLTAFCERVRSRLDEATLAEKQRILQLLIDRVIVGEDALEIRHVIPLGPSRANHPRVRCRAGDRGDRMLREHRRSNPTCDCVRIVYACPKCRDGVASPPVPPKPIPGGIAGAGLVSFVVVSKFADHLPLYRLEDILTRHGVFLARSTLCDWVRNAAVLLGPLAELQKARVSQSSIIWTDDTSVTVLGGEEPGVPRVGSGSTSAMPSTPTASTTSAPAGWRDGPAAFRKDYCGFLQADAYGGYDGIFLTERKIVEVACSAHARWKFFEARWKRRARPTSSWSGSGNLLCRRPVRDLTPEQRQALPAGVVPILDRIEKRS